MNLREEHITAKGFGTHKQKEIRNNAREVALFLKEFRNLKEKSFSMFDVIKRIIKMF